MAKFSGKIGFAIPTDMGNGVTKEVLVEKDARGDLLSDVLRHNPSQKVNEDLSVTNRIKILAGQYINDNKYAIRYVVMDGTPWHVSTIEVQRPNLILNMGRMYNGKRPTNK